MPKIPFWVFFVIAILYFTATRVDTMDIDASQYAEISREMLQKGDYIHLYDRGIDYLDKPPFLFWVSAASMHIFGVNNFGYKFPSILFALWALFATYKLAKLLYGEATGRASALVLACCQGMFLMTNDVRCDTILMSWTITAIWLIQEWLVKNKLYYLLLGFAAIAFGMMTKGPIALAVPAFCFISDWILKRQWRNFFRWAYLPGLVVIAVLLLPMSIGLYQQFDLHPEKIIDHKQGISGLRFFYWSQSFGRITGESPWKNGADISFLLVNMLWSFLPWIFLFIPALIVNIIQLFRQKFRIIKEQEWLTTGGFILSYLALGVSAYQLPHYIFIAFPLAAITTARFLNELTEEGKYPKLYNVLKQFLSALMFIILLVTFVLIRYIFPASYIVVGAWVLLFICWLYFAFQKSLKGKLIWLSATGMIIANIFLTNHVYYTLLQYQVGSQVGRYIHAHTINPGEVAEYKMQDPLNALHFYAQAHITGVDTLSETGNKKYLLTMDKGMDDIRHSKYPYAIIEGGGII